MTDVYIFQFFILAGVYGIKGREIMGVVAWLFVLFDFLYKILEEFLKNETLSAWLNSHFLSVFIFFLFVHAFMALFDKAFKKDLQK